MQCLACHKKSTEVTIITLLLSAPQPDPVQNFNILMPCLPGNHSFHAAFTFSALEGGVPIKVMEDELYFTHLLLKNSKSILSN
jgi:hypothetical protein